MGGNKSKSSTSQVNDFFNQTTNSFVSENSQKVQASALNTNTLLFPRAQFKGCRVAIHQSIDSDVVATGQMNSQNVQDLTTKLKSDANTAIDTAAQQKNGFLAPAIANSTSATTDVKNKVTNIIQNTMSSKTVQDIFANAQNKNFADYSDLYYECDPQYKTPGKCGTDDTTGCDFVVDQNIKSKVVAKGVADALTKALSNVIADSTTTSNLSTSSTLTNQGANDLLDSYFGGLAKLFGVGAQVAALIACVILVAICAVLYFLLSPAGQNVSKQLGGAAASKIGGPKLPI
jgi:hypothetical protein